MLAACFVPLLIPGIVMVSRLRGTHDARLSQLFRNVFVVQEMGILNYHAFDAVSHAARSTELPPGRQQELETWLRAASPIRGGTAPWFGAARGQNLVMLQVESMQNFVLGLRIDGREVTPNLNRWLASEAVWFSGCTDQSAQGRTSDGELLSQVSLHPLREGSAAFRYGGNHHVGIATILGTRGYATLSAVPFEPSFWNRLVTLPAYGYRVNLDVDDFTPGPVVGWGLNDRDFLRQMVPRLATLDRPFATLLITLSNHHPFESFPDELKAMPMGRHEGTPLGNYLHSMNLFDRAFGDFLAGMAKERLLDDTVIALWGDHAAGITWDSTLAEIAGRGYSQVDFYNVDEVPFIVRLPNATLRGERTTRCGLSDVPPTLLALLGVDPANLAFIGRNLLGNPGDGPVVRGYGAWFYRDLLYQPLGATFEQGICYNVETMQRVDLERCRAGSILAREQLAVSHDILEHDLQRELSLRLSK
jgi:phosphoglycerol transferase MdoB-like AlkP superfamily enzyme